MFERTSRGHGSFQLPCHCTYLKWSDVLIPIIYNSVAHESRGELEKAAERDRVEDIIRKLEIYTPIEATATSEALEGRWALAYGSDDPTRSSPFFWAFRWFLYSYFNSVALNIIIHSQAQFTLLSALRAHVHPNGDRIARIWSTAMVLSQN